MKKHDVYIGGQRFTYDEYEYLLNSYKEGLSQSSLSIEKAFAEIEEYEYEIDRTKDENAYQYYLTLGYPEKSIVRDTLRQIVVFYGSKACVFSDQLTDNQRQIDRLYKEYFSYFDEYMFYYAKYDENGNFDKRATFHNMRDLFFNLPALKVAYDKAYNMKMDNLKAWDYATKLDEISISDVLRINEIICHSDIDKVDGYKRTNNDILNASFTPTDKEEVPVEMQKLFADYKNNFGIEILDPNEDKISYNERVRRCYQIFVKEAIFHIRFERIHPFNDGNGRTGRIILNHNLLKNGMAPVIITGIMSDDYKRLIDNNDIEGMAKFLMASSSQQLTNWTALAKAGIKVNKNNLNPKNEKLAEIGESSYGKKLIKRINFLL